jgi:hypothetical protein
MAPHRPRRSSRRSALRSSRSFASRGECSFMYRYISRESCSQFDSLPLTSLTLPITRGLEPKGVKAALVELIVKSYSRGGGSSSSSSGAASSGSESTADVPTVRATYYPARQRLLLEWLSSAVRSCLRALLPRSRARASRLAHAPCAARLGLRRICYPTARASLTSPPVRPISVLRAPPPSPTPLHRSTRNSERI